MTGRDVQDQSGAGEGAEREVVGHVYLRGAAAPIYAGETEAAALARAVRAVPAFRERAARIQAQRAAGYPDAVPAEEVYGDLGIERPPRPRGRKPTNPNGRLLVRLPLSLHKELATKAAAEGVSVNQLVVAYVSRGLGADGAAHAQR
jgi:hypothetical protein